MRRCLPSLGPMGHGRHGLSWLKQGCQHQTRFFSQFCGREGLEYNTHCPNYLCDDSREHGFRLENISDFPWPNKEDNSKPTIPSNPVVFQNLKIRKRWFKTLETWRWRPSALFFLFFFLMKHWRQLYQEINLIEKPYSVYNKLLWGSN